MSIPKETAKIDLGVYVYTQHDDAGWFVKSRLAGFDEHFVGTPVSNILDALLAEKKKVREARQESDEVREENGKIRHISDKIIDELAGDLKDERERRERAEAENGVYHHMVIDTISKEMQMQFVRAHPGIILPAALATEDENG